MQSPFSITAARYREQGLAVLPCGPGTKFPGRYAAAHGWSTAYDWQKYCDRLPTDFELQIWEKWPDGGVCLALGASSAPKGVQLVAVDIDTEDATIQAAIRSCLPGSPVRKRGAKGETEFYLAPTSVPNRPYNDANKVRLLDLLCHGRQTVLPPTIHPDTGQPYRWLTLDTLEDFDVADLPVLPEDIADRLSAALALFGHVDPPKLANGSADPDAEASTHRQLNDAALANLSAWVPALGLYKCRQVGGKYKAVSAWRPSSSGRPLSQRATNLAIGPEGIKDCGEGKGYTPIDLVMAACGADLDSAFRWLQDRVAPVTPIVLTARVVQDDPAPEPFVRTSAPGNLAGLRLATLDGEAVRAGGVAIEAAPARPKADLPNRPLPRELCTPPGLLGDIVEWIDASDEGDAPELALGASIAFLGAIVGRRYDHPSRSARTNFYVAGVAPTGFGKNHALSCIKRLAMFANVDGFLGPGRWKSESAVRKILEAKPTVCCLVDEMGGVMRDILGKRASEHKAGIRDILLELFTAAPDVYTGAEGASEKAVPIIAPNLNVYGASTPSDLWGNFNSGAAADGFLPRWLVFDVGARKPVDREASADARNPPEALRKAIHALLDHKPGGGNLAGITAVNPYTAAWGDGALDFFKTMRAREKEAVAKAIEVGKESTAIILSRAVEHTAKLSLLFAISVDFKAPVITVAGLEWARDVVAHSSAALIRGLEGRVADNDSHAEYLRIKTAVMEAGPNGVLVKQLNRMVDGRFNEKRLGEILSQLTGTGEFYRGNVAPAGGGRPGDRIRHLRDDEREAG